MGASIRKNADRSQIPRDAIRYRLATERVETIQSFGETARAFGATRLQQIFFIALPASLPSVVAALRLGGALVIVGVIVAEMLGAAEGLGFLITRYRTLLNSPGVYAGIILVLVMTGVHEVLLRRLERMVASYREA